MYGIFVNEDGGIHYANAIVLGYKTIETRSRNMLRQLVGERVAVVRTRRNKNPMVVGYVTIKSGLWYGNGLLEYVRDKTLIPVGSKYDKQNGWGYHLEDPAACIPYPLPVDAVRHGRSWCEF